MSALLDVAAHDQVDAMTMVLVTHQLRVAASVTREGSMHQVSSPTFGSVTV